MALRAVLTERCWTCNRSRPRGAPCPDCSRAPAKAERPQAVWDDAFCERCGRMMPCPDHSGRPAFDPHVALRARVAELEHELALLRLPAPANDNGAILEAIGDLNAKVAALFATGRHPSQRLAKGIPSHDQIAGFPRYAVAAGSTCTVSARLNTYIKPLGLELFSNNPGGGAVLDDVRIGTRSFCGSCEGAAIPMDGRFLPLETGVVASPAVPVIIIVRNMSDHKTVTVWATIYGRTPPEKQWF